MILDNPDIIEGTLQALKTNFESQTTKSVDFRKKQLTNLLKGLKELEQEFHDALKLDLGVSKFNSELFSTIITKIDVEHALSHVDKWSKPLIVDTPFVIGPGSSKIIYEPLGVVLVLSAWNYPLYTAIPPMVAAISAGNSVVLKPSELAPHSSNVLKKLVTNYLDQNYYRVIEGAVQVASKITTYPWDLIIFTGSPEKGKLVARAAAENLTPCILELGGKSPTIVDASANLKTAAQRIVQGRFVNAGQTCVACDYILVEEKLLNSLANELKLQIQQFFGIDPSKSQDYPRIITQAHAQRLSEILEQNNHQGQVVCGGGFDINSKYIAPTVIVKPRLDSRVMNEEIFGPILPLIPFNNIKEAIKFVNDRPKPLALYYFGNNKANKQLIEQNTSSGAIVHNDAIFHLLNPDLPFGGVGNSGQSAYHGVTGFRNCSHAKPVFDKSNINFYPFNVRYPPYTEHKQRVLTLFFKFSQLSQRTVQNGVILMAVVLGGRFLSKSDGFIELARKAQPLLQDLYRRLPGL